MFSLSLYTSLQILNGAGKLLCHGTVLLEWCVAIWWIDQMELGPSYHLISVHFRHDDILDCYFILRIFPVPASLFCYIGVIAYVFCHAGVLVCLFVVEVADFWYDVIEIRLSNSKLHYYFVVLRFWFLSFAWGSLKFFSKSFLLQLLFRMLIPIWNSFVSVVIFIGLRFFFWSVSQNLRKLGRCQMTQLI